MPRRDPRTHPNVRAFDREAARYERARPDYPVAGVRALAAALRLRCGTTVVELGSGTGKFTRALAPFGAARLAIEPAPGMRRVFRATVPDVPVLDGTAEAIPLPDGFADAVVAAQAFHWFRTGPALREIARVLRPGGRLGLVWNVRDPSAGWSRRLTQLIDRYRGTAPGSGDRAWVPAFAAPDAPFGPLRHRAFRHGHRGPPELFVDRVLSVSTIAVLPAAERRRVARKVRAILATDPATRGRSIVTMPYRTDVYWARRNRRPAARPAGRVTRGRRTRAPSGTGRTSQGTE
ncbi:MAG TPA: class I SAM-dependent methyltransferase [Thermoplasmata archaeon]|nr:class I SAM-dependent methyltransferase [Thermoplasmata archaeon]